MHTRLQHSNFVKDLDATIEGNLGYSCTHARGVCVRESECVTNICVLNTVRIMFLRSPISPRPPPAPAPAFHTFPHNRSSPQLLYSKGIDVLASHLRQVDHDRRSSFEGFQSQAQWVCCLLFFGRLLLPWCVSCRASSANKLTARQAKQKLSSSISDPVLGELRGSSEGGEPDNGMASARAPITRNEDGTVGLFSLTLCLY